MLQSAGKICIEIFGERKFISCETTSSRPQQQVDGCQVGLDHLHLEELPPREDGVSEAGLPVRYAAVQQMVEGVRRDGRAARRHLVDDREGGLLVIICSICVVKGFKAETNFLKISN